MQLELVTTQPDDPDGRDERHANVQLELVSHGGYDRRDLSYGYLSYGYLSYG